MHREHPSSPALIPRWIFHPRVSAPSFKCQRYVKRQAGHRSSRRLSSSKVPVLQTSKWKPFAKRATVNVDDIAGVSLFFLLSLSLSLSPFLPFSVISFRGKAAPACHRKMLEMQCRCILIKASPRENLIKNNYFFIPFSRSLCRFGRLVASSEAGF